MVALYTNQKPMLGEMIDYSHPIVQGGSLVGIWLMNEGAGNTVQDLSGNGNNGTFDATTPPAWTKGKYGSALEFDSEKINLGTGDIKRASQAGLTIVYAITMSSVAQSDIVISGGKWDTSWAMTHNNNTTVPRAFAFNRNAICGVDFGTGYYVLAFTADAARFDWYKNGIWVDDDVGAGTWEMGVQKATIGASFDGAIYRYHLTDAILHWIYVYDRVLTASEIALLYREPFCFVGQRKRRIGVLAEEIAAGGLVNMAGEASSATLSYAGFRRLGIPLAGDADSITSSGAGLWRDRPLAGAAASSTLSYAGFRRLNIPGAGQADSATMSYAGMTGGVAASVEEIFRKRRLRHSSVYARRLLKGVF